MFGKKLNAFEALELLKALEVFCKETEACALFPLCNLWREQVIQSFHLIHYPIHKQAGNPFLGLSEGALVKDAEIHGLFK